MTKDHVVGRPRSSWCSWACKRPRVAPRACARCETVFTPRNGAARFCEKACQQAAARDRTLGVVRQKRCVVCPGAFEARRGEIRRTCSPACSKIAEERKRSSSPGVRASRLVRQATIRAAEKGLPCALDRAEIAARIRAGRCAVTGVPFDFSLRKDREQHVAPFAPSIDRIDSSKGYTMDNVQIVVWAYNAAKGTGTDEDVVRFARALVAAQRDQAVG